LNFSHDELLQALLEFENIMYRCLLQDNFPLLKETALQVAKGYPLTGDHLDVGIPKKYLSKEVQDTLKEYCKVEDPTKDFTTTVLGVPVNVKIINRKYNYFENTDRVFYHYDNFNVPNPIDSYMKARYLIK